MRDQLQFEDAVKVLHFLVFSLSCLQALVTVPLIPVVELGAIACQAIELFMATEGLQVPTAQHGSQHGGPQLFKGFGRQWLPEVGQGITVREAGQLQAQGVIQADLAFLGTEVLIKLIAGFQARQQHEQADPQ